MAYYLWEYRAPAADCPNPVLTRAFHFISANAPSESTSGGLLSRAAIRGVRGGFLATMRSSTHRRHFYARSVIGGNVP